MYSSKAASSGGKLSNNFLICQRWAPKISPGRIDRFESCEVLFFWEDQAGMKRLPRRAEIWKRTWTIYVQIEESSSDGMWRLCTARASRGLSVWGGGLGR